VSETGSGPDELAFSPAENPAATAAGGVAAEEPVTTAPPADIPEAEATPVKKRPWWVRRYTFTGTAVGRRRRGRRAKPDPHRDRLS
jgi:hypothetical protein